MKPTIGYIVHYRSCGGGIYPAIVTAAMPLLETVALAIFKPGGISFRSAVEEGEGSGTWHWPERKDCIIRPMGVEEAERQP